jgi:hypothetical protein
MKEKPQLSNDEIGVLRKLAEKKLKISEDAVNLERREAWLKHDEGASGRRPMILAEFEGVMDAKRPIPEEVFQCQSELGLQLEKYLRWEIYRFEVLKDDHVVEPFIPVGWKMEVSNYGVESVKHSVSNNGQKGSISWDAPILDLDRDFSKLHPRTYSVDREETLRKKAYLEEVFSGILPVEIRGAFWWTMGMTIRAIDLIGLENLMLFMFDNPEGLHRLMAFLRDDHLAYAKWLEDEGLLTLNNKNDYIGSGSMGYTRTLGAGNGVVTQKDLWVLLESQETVGVGPDQFEEFVFPYQQSIAEHFGKVYYGCCEPVHTRWDILKRIPNLERVSVSPWCNEEIMAKELGDKYVYSRKPNPTQISTGEWNEEAIRADLRKTLNCAGNGRLEIIMKDVHTLNNEPERLPRWVEIAREEASRLG